MVEKTHQKVNLTLQTYSTLAIPHDQVCFSHKSLPTRISTVLIGCSAIPYPGFVHGPGSCWLPEGVLLPIRMLTQGTGESAGAGADVRLITPLVEPCSSVFWRLLRFQELRASHG
jgi:hypothetical protein